MKTKLVRFLSVLASLALPFAARAQGTAFTYQGFFTQNGGPFNGNVEIQFTLWDAATAGTQLAATSPSSTIAGATNGLFTTAVDFGGAAFTGADRWMQMDVRTTIGAFTTVLPRQKLAPTPYAVLAGKLAGTLASNQLAGTYGGAVSFTNGGNTFIGVFTGNGGGLTNMSAAGLTGTVPAGALSNAWKLTGNAGTTPGANFLGTTDTNALELRVNGKRALRLEPTPDDDINVFTNVVNVVGGSSVNFIAPGVRGATIGGGGAQNYGFETHFSNSVMADFGTVGGGGGNVAGGLYSSVGGGRFNDTLGGAATIAGGSGNYSGGDSATVGGGSGNSSLGIYATIGGGSENVANNNYTTIGGGAHNSTSADYATLGGGNNNDSTGNSATVGGGANNLSSGLYATVGGGLFNQSTSTNATVGGGRNNRATGTGAFIGGGGYDGTIISGNIASGIASTIGGGLGNAVSNSYATIAGGISNHIAGADAFIGGGKLNFAYGNESVVSGGQNNTVIGNYATIGGGYLNNANGDYSTIPGGFDNVAAGNYSFAAGKNCNVQHNNSFMWSDGSLSFSTVAPNTFNALSTGGYFLYSGSGVGVQVPPGGNAWSFISDRNVKENFAPVDARAVLEKVVAMPVTTWNLKSQPPEIRHIGAMAQDFAAAFAVGEDNRHISTSDADGVALAAIQGLNQKLEETRAENAMLKSRLERLEKLLVTRQASR